MTNPVRTSYPVALAASPSLLLGDGLDQFRMSVWPYMKTLTPTDFGGWVLSVAIFVTAWSVLKVVRQLRGPVNGPGDMTALVSYGMHRTAIAIGVRAPSVVWGTVHDSATGRALPLATVRLAGTDGEIVDACVSDARGRFGFGLPCDEVVARGYRLSLEVRKSGYYPASAPRELTLLASEHPVVDIPMDRSAKHRTVSHAAEGSAARFFGTAVFWAGVMFVPLQFVADPGLFSALLLAVFGVAAFGRALHFSHARP